MNFQKIKNNLKRPLSIVYIKFLTQRYYKKMLKNIKYLDKFNKLMVKKEKIFNKYFLKHYKYIINDEQSKFDSIDKQPKIFVCWLQGIQNAPHIIKLCYESLQKMKNGAEVILLDKNNITQYAKPDKKIQHLFKGQKISMQNYADYCRIKILENYNALWIDATVFVLNKINLEIFDKEYYSIKSPRLYENKPEYLLCPNFPFGQVYLLAGTNKRFFHQIAHFFEDYLKSHSVYLDYFMIYYFMNFLYTYDVEDKKIIDNLECNNEKVEDYFYYRKEEANYIPVNKNDIFAKFSYKTEDIEKILNEDNLLTNIIRSTLKD